jgi:hypothetical protein
MFLVFRSVHNIRIERLWVDVTQGFGRLWYNFFYDLEFHHHLDPDYDEHIWLLHYLFLASINQNAHRWAEGWNHHKLSRVPDRRREKPITMFQIDSLLIGRYGPPLPDQPDPEPVDDPAFYGVDWEGLQDQDLLRHHNHYNSPISMDPNSQPSTHRPSYLNLVEVPTFVCPFSEEEADMFEETLLQHPEFYSENPIDRALLWSIALNLMVQILQARS